MKSYLTSKFRNIFYDHTRESNVTTSRKRKRFEESESGGTGDDDEVIITAVKRPKLTTTTEPGSNSNFLSIFSVPYQRMSDWVKNKCSWSDMFNFRKVNDDSRKRNGQGGMHYQSSHVVFNGPASSSAGTSAPCWPSDVRQKTSSTTVKKTPPTTMTSSTITQTEDSFVNGDTYTEDSISECDSISRGTQYRRKPSLFDRKPRFTANECVQLEEKERYRQLLQQLTTASIGSHKEQNRERLKTYQPSSIQNESILGSSVLDNLTRFDQLGSSRVQKQKIIPTSTPGDSYGLIQRRTEAVDLLRPTASSYARQQLAARSKKESKLAGKDLDTSVKANGDSSFRLTPEKQAEISRRVPSPEFKDSKFLHEEWLTELKSKYSSSVRDRERKINEELIKTKIYEERRKANEENLEKQIRYRLKILEKEPPIIEDIPIEIEEEEEEKEAEFPALTDEMLDKVKHALRPNPPDEVLVEGYRLQVTRKDIATLDGLNWLNDEIINFYMNMLTERGEKENYPKVYAFNTFFYPKLTSGGHDAVRRWTRRIDVFAVDYIIIPVHLGMHWCLSVVDFKKKSVRYFDSMGGNNVQCLNAMKKYLCDESLDKKKTKFDLTGWTTDVAKNIPQQMNGSDCGMFACKYAEYITREAEITFTQQHMPYFRKRMVYEILTKTLLQ